MTLKNLLQALISKGVMLRVEGDALHYDAPRGALTPEVRDAMRQHKLMLVMLVEAYEERSAIIE